MIEALFETTKSKPLATQALSGRNLRQKMISSNISNIDTPFYKAKDVNFEDALIKKANKMYNQEDMETPKLKLAQTNGAHLSGVDDNSGKMGTIFLRDGHMARNDANTVDIDVETSELSKNVVMINALTQGIKKEGAIFKSVLEASGKV